MIDHSQEPYLCSLCKRPIHPTEGALCVVCRHLNRERRHRERSMRAILAEHPRLGVMWALVRSGVYNDWPSDYPQHAYMQTQPAGRKPDQVRWETELAVLLGMMDVQLDDTGHDSSGDFYIGGWWQLPGHDAA